MTKSEIKKIIQDVRLTLLRKSIAFFGLQCSKLDWEVVPDLETFFINEKGEIDSFTALAYVKVLPTNTKNRIAAYGTINICESLLENYSVKNIAFTIIHEVMHVLADHGRRKGSRDDTLWALCIDHDVNYAIKQIDPYEEFIQMHEGAVLLTDILPEKLHNALPEEIYDYLNKNQKKLNIQILGKLTDETKNKNNKGFGIIPVKINGKEYQVKVDLEKLSKHQQEIIKRFISSAKTDFEMQKQRGMIPSHTQEIIDKLISIKVPWEEILKAAIKTNIILKPSGRSWRNLNIYFRNLGINSPGVSYEEDNEGIGKLIVCLDTSGSISKKLLKKFCHVIMQSMTHFKTIQVLVHDVKVHEIVEFDKENIQEFDNFIKNKIKGRGGTSHEDAFKKINEEFEDNPEDISMVICLTDADSDIENLKSWKLDWINVVPLILLQQKNYDYNKKIDGKKLGFEKNKFLTIEAE